MPECSGDLTQGSPLAAKPDRGIFLGPVIDRQHHKKRDAYTWDKTGQEHGCDADAAIGAVYDHQHAGRDDRSHGGGTGIDGRRHIGGIPFLFHDRDHHAPKGGRICIGRTGDPGHDQIGYHIDLSQSAADVAYQGGGKAHQPFGDLSVFHDVSNQQEQGDRQQRVAVDHTVHLLDHDERRDPAHKTGD